MVGHLDLGFCYGTAVEKKSTSESRGCTVMIHGWTMDVEGGHKDKEVYIYLEGW